MAARRSREVALEYGRLIAHPRHICGYWWRGTRNFGDEISPLILEWASGSKVLKIENLPMWKGPVYLAVGSILDGRDIRNAVIWGSGFKSVEGRMAKEPHRVLAVRGPLTRENLIHQGINCPEVYGDPGLLARRLFNPPLTGEFDYGIIPHYKEKGMVPSRLLEKGRVSLIDVQSTPANFVRDLCRCKRVLSSSLHGLITADVFGIPSAHFSQSDLVLGGRFKFKDYYGSVGREDLPPLDLNKIKDIEEASDSLVVADVRSATRELLEASPFPAR